MKQAKTKFLRNKVLYKNVAFKKIFLSVKKFVYEMNYHNYLH